MPRPVAFVFGGELDLAPIRGFMERFAEDYFHAEYVLWERSPYTTAVRAIAELGGSSHLIGVLLLAFQRKHVRVERVIVDPAWRRQRIATNMFYRMVLEPKVHRFATVSAICPDNNDSAIAWLRRCRFRAISVLPATKPALRDRYLFSWSFDNLTKRDQLEICTRSAATLSDSRKRDPSAPAEGYGSHQHFPPT